MNSVGLIDTRTNEAFILSLMLKDKDSRIEILNKLKVEYFSRDLHKRLYKTIEIMEKNTDEIDLALVMQKMNELKLLEKGDITAVTEISTELSSVATLGLHIEKLIDGFKSNEFKKKMFNYVTSNEELDTDSVINELSKIIETRKTEDTSTVQLQDWLINELGRRMNLEKPQPLGLLTGFKGLDGMLKGIVPGSVVTLLARSGVGKTTFSIELSKKIAAKNEPIVYFSLEMLPEQMYLKMVLTKAGLQIDDYLKITSSNTGYVDPLIKASVGISALDIKILQEANIKKIVNNINYYVRKCNTKVFFIDYLNIVNSDSKSANTDILFNEITAELKQVALKTGSIIFLITQANRAVDSQQDKRPNLKDIKSSSSVEQNSDYIISLYRNLEFNNPIKIRELLSEGKVDYNAANADLNPECFELIVLKNRHTGDCGTIPLKYTKTDGFENWEYKR